MEGKEPAPNILKRVSKQWSKILIGTTRLTFAIKKDLQQEGNDWRNEQIFITGFTRKQNMQILHWQGQFGMTSSSSSILSGAETELTCHYIKCLFFSWLILFWTVKIFKTHFETRLTFLFSFGMRKLESIRLCFRCKDLQLLPLNSCCIFARFHLLK